MFKLIALVKNIAYISYNLLLKFYKRRKTYCAYFIFNSNNSRKILYFICL